jgi:hypothetical protein
MAAFLEFTAGIPLISLCLREGAAIFNLTSLALLAIFIPSCFVPSPRVRWEMLPMTLFDPQKHALVGPAGDLVVRDDDEIALKLAMLFEGECTDLGPLRAAVKFGFCKQRYFQIRQRYTELGAAALQSHPRGPKTNYRRTDELVCQVIRHRFLDPDASPDVIAQKLRQAGFVISTRSVQRVIEQFGLQKKPLSLPS